MKACDTGKKDMRLNFSIHLSASPVNEIVKTLLKVFDLIFNCISLCVNESCELVYNLWHITTCSNIHNSVLFKWNVHLDYSCHNS